MRNIGGRGEGGGGIEEMSVSRLYYQLVKNTVEMPDLYK